MMKISITYLALACCFTASIAPVFADDAAAATSDPSRKITSSSKASVPARILGAIVGTVVGTPVCMVRRTIWDTKDGIRGIVGETDNKLAIYSAGAFWFPFGMTSGVLSGPFYSFKHSMCNTDKPFSKEQFSLGDQVE